MEQCTVATLSTCQQTCQTMYFGLRDFYDIRTNTCEKWIVCPSGSTLDNQINKCISPFGKIIEVTETQPIEIDCGLNAYWNTDFEACFCKNDWFRNPETHACDQTEPVQVQTYGD